MIAGRLCQTPCSVLATIFLRAGNFVIWKIHMPSDPDELPPDQKIIMGPDKAVPGYTIIPKKP